MAVSTFIKSPHTILTLSISYAMTFGFITYTLDFTYPHKEVLSGLAGYSNLEFCHSFSNEPLLIRRRTILSNVKCLNNLLGS